MKMTTERTSRSVPRRALSASCWFMCVALSWPALAFGQGIPSNMRAAILLRALQYEKVFSSGTNAVTLLVLSGGGGVRDGSEMTAALRQLAQAGASARKVVVEELRGESSTADLQK